MRWTRSFRTRILLIVVMVAVVPLGLIGLWLTRTAARSGEELLRARLDDALSRTVAQLATRWLQRRSQLLDLAEDPTVRQRLLDSAGGAGNHGHSQVTDAEPIDSIIERRFANLGPVLMDAVVRDLDGRARWILQGQAAAGSAGNELTGSGIAVAVDVYESPFGRRLGILEATLAVSALLRDGGGPPAVFGMVLGVFDPSTGASLLPLPFDPELLSNDRFVWGGDAWRSSRRALVNPPIELVAAAPLGPFTQPFEEAARRGAWLLTAVALAGFFLAVLFTGRMTRSLERLAVAADAVSHGDLERRVDDAGDDEIGRLARAFNTMTESLRRTLRNLADREALAAVGEFAASLAHEVRNPLTSIRVDLQRVEEQLPEDSPLRVPQARALEEIARLDATVTSALQVASTKAGTTESFDLLTPLRAAAHAAAPAFEERRAILRSPGADTEPIRVRGDTGALEQLFLNLLLNAAQALARGGDAMVEVEAEGQMVVVSVRDTGAGIPADELKRVFEPLFSTRSGGTGLGLTVAQRIARAHGGEIEIESAPGAGTTVRVLLPL